MICNIQWKDFNRKDWQERYQKLRRAGLLQSYSYGQALYTLKGCKMRLGMIGIDNREAGLVLVLESMIFGNALHAIVLDRGPLWFEGFGTLDHNRLFFAEIKRQFPRRWGRKRRIIPEMDDSKDAQNMMKSLGYRRIKAPGYQTIWINLNKEPDVLRAAMKSNWRNKLNKAEKQGFRVEWDCAGEHFPWLLKVYALDKHKKNYEGPSVNLLKELQKTFLPEGNMVIGRIILDGRAVAAMLVLCHGTSATWQIGWTGDKGRKTAAQHLLLWDSFRFLKERDIHDFDLGGVNDVSASHVKTFKEGLGGELVQLVGQYA